MILRIRVKDSNGKEKIITIPYYQDDVAWDSGGGGDDTDQCDNAYVDDGFVNSGYIETGCA